MRWLVDAKLKGGVLAAVRARAPSAVVRRISSLLLMQLPKPVPMILSGTNDSVFGPAELLSLRRSLPGPIRFAPAIIVGAARTDVEAWIAAGALPVRNASAPEQQVDLVEEALRDAAQWVVSSAYIGPCRRRRKPVFLLNARRATDHVVRAAKAKTEGLSGVSAAALPRLHRRMMCAVVAIDSAPVEQRRDFVELVEELDAAARASGDVDLVRSAARLRIESRRLLPPARLDRAAFEAAVSEFVAAVNARAA